MIYIAHRGLIDGPDITLENHPLQIMTAIELGYHCEVDLRLIDDKLYLGHDEPQYEVDEYWLRDSSLWIHAKNIEALYWLSTHKTWQYNYFWHENDQYTLTSKGYIWTNPGQTLTNNSVMVMPEHVDENLSNAIIANCYAICSDFVNIIKLGRTR
jgi:hypothetical protein